MTTFPGDVAGVLAEAVRLRPEQEAIVTRSTSASYRQLDALANRAAHALLGLGIGPGDRIAACLPNDIGIVAAFHGAMRIGAVWVGVGETLTAAEKAHILDDTTARALICTAPVADQITAHATPLRDLRATVADAAWQSLLAAQPETPPLIAVDPDAPAAIAYTSGTTGVPKGAVHSQRNLLLPGWYLARTRRYDHTLRKGDCFPLTILNMMVLTTLLTAQAQGCAVIMDSMASDAVVQWIRREQVQVWNGPPPVLYTLAHDPTVLPSDLASLREVWSGGAECPPAIRQAFEAKFAQRIFSTYGQTEAPAVVTIESPSQPHAPGMTGPPLPHLDLTIRGAGGELAAPGESGEVCVAPRRPEAIRAALAADWGVELDEDDEPPVYTPMIGYWQRPQESRKALADDLLRTGDTGCLEDGGLRLTGRLNLIVNRGGANVYPAEVERVVLELPEVEACAVFGVPDDRLGERVALLVQFATAAEPSHEPILERCRAELAPYKVPELVGAIDAFPRNAMGKIDRKALAGVGGQLVHRVAAPA